MQQSNKEIDRLKKTITVWGIVYFVVILAMVIFSLWYIANLAEEIERVADMVNATGQVELTIKRNSLLGADYLAIAIPVMVGLAGALVTFLGMNRLSMFDERIDKIQQDLKDDLDSRTKDIPARVDANLKSVIDDKWSEQKDQIEKKKKEILMEIENAFNQIHRATEEGNRHIGDIYEIITSFETHYGWLRSTVRENVGELNVSTVSDAHRLVEDLRIKKPADYMSMIKKIIDRVCNNNERLSGDSDDYHNLAAELARGYLYESVLRVLNVGVHAFPNDTDLLADTIEYATKGGFPDDAKKAVEKLLSEDIPRNLWTWRCYEFIIDYYKARGELSEADQLCNEFVAAMPYDQHGYRSMSEIKRLLHPGEYGLDEAISILRGALNKGVNAPQCAQALADIFLEKGQYQDAIDYASRAILELAQPQPSIGNANIVSKRGNAYDRLFMKTMSDGKLDIRLAANALQDYQMALSLEKNSLGVLSPIQKRQILFRISLLSGYLPNMAEEDEN